MKISGFQYYFWGILRVNATDSFTFYLLQGMQLPYKEALEGRHSQPNQIYHLVFTTKGRKPYFSNFSIARIFISTLKFSHNKGWCSSLAFVVMPDHVHWLIELKSRSLSKLVKSVKEFSSKKIKAQLKINKGIWQQGYYEQTIRKEEDMVSFGRYIILNPVRSGLVNSVREYPHWDAIWF